MGNTTHWVRAALDLLGWDVPDNEVKIYIREHTPQVPQSQVGLALRKLRASQPRRGRNQISRSQGELFAELND